MTPFTRLHSPAVVIDQDSIDTDVILPARFLLQMEREGLGQRLFADRRFGSDGKPIPDFPLNDPVKQGASILLAGANFGCGSSREHAVWALADYGFRCVMAPSFGEIFFNNCVKNGVLPIVFETEHRGALKAFAESGATFLIDLPSEQVSVGPLRLPINLHESASEMLVNGWDEADVILERHAAAIGEFEGRRDRVSPWLCLNAQGAS